MDGRGDSLLDIYMCVKEIGGLRVCVDVDKMLFARRQKDTKTLLVPAVPLNKQEYKWSKWVPPDELSLGNLTVYPVPKVWAQPVGPGVQRYPWRLSSTLWVLRGSASPWHGSAGSHALQWSVFWFLCLASASISLAFLLRGKTGHE